MSFVTDSEIFNRLSKYFKQKKISSQVTITYALILSAVMLVSNFFTDAGIQYLFHHQAARAIELSVNRMMKDVDSREALLDMNATFSGVIVRIKDSEGKLIKDSSPHFPPTEKMLTRVVQDKPFFAGNDYQLIETPHSLFYYKEVPFEVDGETFSVQVFKTITFEKELMYYMALGSFLLDLAGLILAIGAGYFLMRKVLNPLKKITETAREISAGNMEKRLAVEGTGNEVEELSASFNFMLDKIQETFKRQQQFISDASHELRTPLTVIDGYAEILEKFGAKDEELFNESVSVIRSETGNMKRLVESLLFFARADNGEQHLEKIPVDVEEILREVVKSFNNRRIEFFSDGNFETLGDETALKKMFAAILDNALKYSKDKVTINLKIVGDMATVHIVDRGIGISAEDKGKIFDRFYRVDKSRTNSEDENSVGLGLSVAKFIADNHDIKIKIDSELGRGTDFILGIRE